MALSALMDSNSQMSQHLGPSSCDMQEIASKRIFVWSLTARGLTHDALPFPHSNADEQDIISLNETKE